MALDRVVEIAFGFGPFDTGLSWTDVSDHVAVHGDTVWASSSSGRTGDGISPGQATVTFENHDGRFDPRNTGGPSYGDLKVGTPIRFRCPTTGDPDGTVWSGFVASGWPKAVTTTFRTVTVTCHDLFGLLAQGSAPATAFDATVRRLPRSPDHWWRPGPTGWEDQVTGVTARHAGVLEEMDPVLNGDEGTWGQASPDGWGHTTSPASGLPNSADPYDWTIVSAWIRLVPAAERPTVPVLGWPQPVTVIDVEADFTGGLVGPNPRLILNVTWDGVVVGVATYHGRGNWATDQPLSATTLLMDGLVHHIVAAVRPAFGYVGAPPPGEMGEAHMWIDGREINLSVNTMDAFIPGSTLNQPLDVTIGVGGAFSPFQGVIDHIMTWGDYPGTVDDRDALDELANGLFNAGRFGWAGQRLDERASAIVAAMGAGDRLGAIDTSGIVTLQSYRPAEPLQLVQTIEDTEQGRIWVDRHGELRYSNRQWAWHDPRSTTPQAVFSTIGTDIDTGAIVMMEDGTDILDDPLDLVNVAQVTSAFGRMQTVRDDASIAAVGQRNPMHLSGLLHRSDAESRAIGEWLIASRSTPRPKARQVTFDADDPHAGAFAVEVSEGDLVTITVGAPTDCDGTPIGADLHLAAHVTQVSRTWSRDSHLVTLSLDSTRTDSTWFRWGTSEWDNTDSEGWSF